MKRPLAAVLLVAAGLSPAVADEAADRAARWHDVAASVFGSRAVSDDGDALLSLAIPDRTMDAALVPLTVELTGKQPVVAVSVVVDNNPSPLVGTFRLGPAFVQQSLKMRIRVNEFTPVHAIAETADGKLHAVSKYVKAAGGCSAPSAVSSPETLARMGKMLLRRERSTDSGVVDARLLISHPNYNGMQSDAKTGKYTPARYLEHIAVRVGGAEALNVETGISMSEDPSISFTYQAKAGGAVDVSARDSSSAVFAQHFDALD